MKLFERLWTTFSSVLNILTLSPFSHDPGHGVQQIPLFDQDVHLATRPGPIFRPPGRLRRGINDKFQCDYTAMKGWTNCSTPSTRECWLENKSTGEKRDIYTNYELESQTPIGIVRNYTLNVNKAGNINVDGMDFLNGFMFNEKYPGPWIQACWGDTLSITVNVDPSFDMGTSVHWHGIRQWLTMHMDGVPGITQCPIAPGSSFTYEFRAMQYGSSWYHSHYSLQYADGLLGPMTIHGPSSANWDIAPEKPLFVSDWNHNVATFNPAPNNRTVLLGGIGNMTRSWPGVPVTQHHDTFNITFIEDTRYLLRIINVAYDSTFLFSIDNHNFTVISADFVPIKPYNTTSIVVGIGQRYNIVVQANPINSYDKNFWIRTHILNGTTCHTSGPPPGPDYMKTGIIRYDESNRDDPTTTQWAGLDTSYCRDEPAFTPIVKWKPKAPANPQEPNRILQLGRATDPNVINRGFFSFITPDQFNANPQIRVPLRIDWQNITFLNLDNTGGWNATFVILPEQFNETQWIYLVMTNPRDDQGHPIHLHGHDFAIIDFAANKTFNASQPIVLKDNPPRRDVVYLPELGYVVIAFKADNPGAWLIHCHIARHASLGLAMQVLEDRVTANQIWQPHVSPAWIAADDICTEWKNWCQTTPFGNCSNIHVQDDSGI